MDANTSEVVGRLARWVLLAAAAVTGAATVMMVLLGGLPGSLAAAAGWAVVPDAVARQGRYVRVRSRFRPRQRRQFPAAWWLHADRTAARTWLAPNGDTVLMEWGGFPPGPHGFDVAANPYSGCRLRGEGRAGYAWPKGTEVLLLDARALVMVTPEGRLDDRAGSGWRRDAGRVRPTQLAPLAHQRPLAYLVRVPLRDYERTRTLLRRAPAGAVLPAAAEWDRPADLDDVRVLLKSIRRTYRRAPRLVTGDVALARAAAAEKVPVLLVGDHPPLPPPSRNVPDWPSLPSQLP